MRCIACNEMTDGQDFCFACEAAFYGLDYPEFPWHDSEDAVPPADYLDFDELPEEDTT